MLKNNQRGGLPYSDAMRVMRYTYTGKEIRTFKIIQLNWNRKGLKEIQCQW